MSPSLGGASGGGSVFFGSGPPTAPTRTDFGLAAASTANTSGAFALQLRGQTTAPISFDATMTDAANALAALSTVGLGNVASYPGYETATVNDGGFLIFLGAFDFTAAEPPTVVDDTTDNGVAISPDVTGGLGIPADAAREGDQYVDLDAGVTWALRLGTFPTIPKWVGGGIYPASLRFPTPPLPLPGYLGVDPVATEPLVWSRSLGGWVQDAVAAMAFNLHSSTDAADILTQVPTLSLRTSFLVGGRPPDTTPFSYVDHLPADGHAGPQRSALNSVAGSPFEVALGGYYGVAKLDGSAACFVPTSGVIPTGAAPAGTYNVDGTLLDWAHPRVIGTDLTADPDNHWIHSTTGGMVVVYALLWMETTYNDYPPIG